MRAADEEAAECARRRGRRARRWRGRAPKPTRGAGRAREVAAARREEAAATRPPARARELIYEARVATREVLRDGETLSGHLRELSDSLRANAERLLLDIRAAHAEMTARLDRVDPDLGALRGPPGPPRAGRRRRTPSPTSPSSSRAAAALSRASVRHTN